MRASQRFFTKLHLPVAALIGLMIPSLSSADTLHVTDDTFIDLSQPTTANGDRLDIQISNTAGVKQGFVRFDLSTLPASTVDADIDSATLRFWVKDVIDDGGTIGFHLVNGPWTEGGLGPLGVPPIDPSAFASVNILPADEGSYVSVDVTPAVIAWLSSNNGLAMISSGVQA